MLAKHILKHSYVLNIWLPVLSSLIFIFTKMQIVLFKQNRKALKMRELSQNARTKIQDIFEICSPACGVSTLFFLFSRTVRLHAESVMHGVNMLVKPLYVDPRILEYMCLQLQILFLSLHIYIVIMLCTIATSSIVCSYTKTIGYLHWRNLISIFYTMQSIQLTCWLPSFY